jgi:alkylation response protein AidB-like acyl-CoA dehydrogenase
VLLVAVFEFSEEQQELRSAVQTFAEKLFPEAEVRRVADSDLGYDEAAWQQLTQQLGLTGLLVPAELGGAGAGFVELAVALEMLAARLAPTPLLSSALATVAILSADDPEAAAALLPDIASGDIVATLAVAEPTGLWSADAMSCAATETETGWRLDGEKTYVTDGVAADLLIIAARAADGVAFFAVDGAAPKLRRTGLTGFDVTRRLARVELAGVAARRLGRPDQGAAFEKAMDRVRVLVSAEALGGADAILKMAVAYAKDRVQFGRAIGSFQAIKHMCADALLDVESARSAAYYAAWAADEDSLELPVVAPLAKAFCSDTYFATASMAIQVHGGIAFTWEHPAHLYYRRAKSDAQLWGDPVPQRELLATRLGL